MWAAIREEPPWEHVNAALGRVGSAGLRIGTEAKIARFGFEGPEQVAVDLLRARPFRIHELAAAGKLSPRMTQLLVYCLLVTKQLELVRESLVPAIPTPLAAADSEPSSSRRTASLAEPPATPSSLAVARLQLQGMQMKSRAAVEARADELPWDDRLTPPADARAVHARGARGAPSTRGVERRSLAPPAHRPHARSFFSPVTARAPKTAPPKAGAADLKATVLSAGVVRAEAPPSVAPKAAKALAPPLSSSPPSKSDLPQDLVLRRQEIVDRAGVIDRQNYFEMLGVSRDAMSEQVQQAFLSLAKKWHPDRVPPVLAEVKDQCARVFAHMSEAHQTLLDVEKRARYMTLLREGGATPESQAEIVRVVEAATNFQKAEICLKRNDVAQAEELLQAGRGRRPRAGRLPGAPRLAPGDEAEHAGAAGDERAHRAPRQGDRQEPALRAGVLLPRHAPQAHSAGRRGRRATSARPTS